MAWFKVDDNLAFHPKVLRAGNAAIGLWARAGAWCAQQLTDGFVPSGVVVTLGGKRADARRLVDAGLWLEVDGGYLFHQWGDRQPSRVEVEEKRAAAAERQRRAREAARAKRDAEAQMSQRDSRAMSQRDSRVSHIGSHAPPDPTRPDPTPTTKPPAGAAAPPSAQTLVAEWVEACGERPPDRVVGQVAREVGNLIGEGIPYDDVRNGLRSWHAKRLHPSTIASEVHATRLGPPVNGAKPSTTDQRVQAGLDLAAQLREAEQAGTPAIGA